MKALSVRQPWAWLIVNGLKPVENRSWNTKFRGQVLIHAAKGMTRKEYDEAVKFCRFDCLLEMDHRKIPSYEKLERGGIVGVTTITDCVSSHPSPFFSGPKGFVLEDSRPLEFTPIKGKLSFFDTGFSIGEDGDLWY
jgi:hypothetical protein